MQKEIIRILFQIKSLNDCWSCRSFLHFWFLWIMNFQRSFCPLFENVFFLSSRWLVNWESAINYSGYFKIEVNNFTLFLTVIFLLCEKNFVNVKSTLFLLIYYKKSTFFEYILMKTKTTSVCTRLIIISSSG